jgi:hypothetical protein
MSKAIWIMLVLLITSFITITQSPVASAEYDYTATISYSGCWKGHLGDLRGSSSIEGCGDQTFELRCDSVCSITVQKEEDNQETLCVSIESSRACTSAGYGIASTSYNTGGTCCGAIFLPLVLLGSVFVKKKDRLV